ncbi:MAG: hypothetical protein M1825_005780 [Sarcosagium campestre]|nr:MAG: hypothetical protein M1825_005780 [Sarcosagium campestre]
MFSMMNSEPHAIRKRMLANIYSKSFLQRSAALDAQSANIIYCRLLPLLDRHAIVKKPIEIYEVFLGTSMDFITAYSFGLSTSSNFIEDVEERRRWIGLYQCRHPYSFYTQEVRGVTTWLCQLGVRLVPQSVDVATQAMESWCAEMCDLAGSKLDLSKMVHGNEISPVDYPVAYGQLRDSLRKRRSKANDEEKVEFLEQEKLEIASEMCDHMIAGHETSGITLTYLTYELSKNQKLQQLLRNELLEMSPSYRSLHIDQTGDVDSLELPSPTDLDALPLLNAIVQETFRLYPAIAGGQARVTPTNKTVKLGDYDAIPGGIRVGARASTLHQNPDVFPSPTEFQPQRWLDATPEQRAEMHRWLWVFGSGGRMCIGSNFAIHEIKIVAAALYSNYHTSIVDAPDMRPSDAYSGNPSGGKLLINVQRVYPPNVIMGVPKFFRWMSERYPAISQLIAENRIPEFDCLYLDMNGIIHNCTHSDSDSPTFRMTEDKMFIAIFNYIEHLFGKIKPKQLFFMAIDGVAPRAKMNQQRARRFRTALDAERAKEKALREGVQMPAEAAFDSNCITPGTEFMAKLTKQLKYFINKKVSEDVEWQGVEVVLSGHEVPGEGEHKIMEYIRLAKAQSDYDPNVRHCLYGLDADLIMLGLLSHDPHFCLLREEVTFGRQNQKKSKELEHQNFYLMHLCMVREYLELEFQELKEPGALRFPFDLERVIDDFILMAFFVGNDFLPNLPNLHINEGALALMFKEYKDCLPKAQGYINEGGVIHLDRLVSLLDQFSRVEYRFFEAENSDASWMRSKQLGDDAGAVKNKKKGRITMSSPQRDLFRMVKVFVNSRSNASDAAQILDLPATLPAGDRKFVQELAENLHLQWKSISDEQGDRHLRLQFPEDRDPDETEDEEADAALFRIMKKYETAEIVDVTAEDAQQAAEAKYQQKFQNWKDKYYVSKFGWDRTNEVEMRKLAENYVQGLQWVLYYYYQGVASWPWFYEYHYSPMISDVKLGMEANLKFELGQPFHPFEQLMGVLPDRSKSIVPTPYHDLMTNPDSPIIDFYPRDFELDMNGKKMEWEAVVKIPFIDEKRLLSAMQPKYKLLTEDERQRNEFGSTLKFTYSSEHDFTYPSSLIGIFPEISHCHCVPNIFELPTIEGLRYNHGLMKEVKLGEAALAGFPSLRTLQHTGALGFHGVNVFQQDSRNESMVATLLDSELRSNVEVAKQKLGKKVHVGYPFLQEAKVVRVSDELFDYVLPESGDTQVIPVPHGPKDIAVWHSRAERIESFYSKRLGIVIGQVESLMHVEMLRGLRKTDDGATIKEYAKIPGIETDYASQAVVYDVISEDQRFLEKAALPIEQEYPVGSRAFFLGEFNYGRPLEITRHIQDKAEVFISTVKGKEPDFGRRIVKQAEHDTPYVPSFAVARMLNLNPLVLSKITASFSVMINDSRVNLGLNLKFEAKKQKVLGYSRRGPSGWEFSGKAIDLLQRYMVSFPEFVAGIQRNPKGDIYKPTDFYPAETAAKKMQEIQTWLKKVALTQSFEKVPLEAEQMDSDTVKLIEEAADRQMQSSQGVEGKKIKGVPRNALLKPSDAEHRLGGQHFAMGDRVVYVQDSGRVPIATRGTVVGLTRTSRTTLLDIVFDVTFMSGTSLGDRCTPFRGSTVPAATVLNLTDRQVIVNSKAAAAAAASSAPRSQPLTVNGYDVPTGPGERARLVEAGAPPPLRGSFRGAVAAQPNGVHSGARGRGRGGIVPAQPWQQDIAIRTSGHIRGGGNGGGRGRNAQYGPIDRDPQAGVVPTNANFRPQSYSNVPPPASLDAQRGGSGNGNGSGTRGGRGARGGASRGRRARGAPFRGGEGRPVLQNGIAAASTTQSGQ